MILRELALAEVGFDYPQAIRELNHRYTYQQIAGFMGYRAARAVKKVMEGATPNHLAGERLYILYVETLRRKPPPIK